MLTINSVTYSDFNNEILFKNLGYTCGDCSLVIIRSDNLVKASILLEIIATLRDTGKNNILYANEDVTDKRYFNEYCEMMQYISENDGLLDEFTVEQNLNFFASLKNSKELVASAISYFSIMSIANEKVNNLSDSDKKKVSLARLIACNCEIWLLDNPFYNLDEMTSIQLAGLIGARCEQGGIVILSSQEDVPLKNYREIILEDYK